jgi:hypothetical protein
MAAVPVIVPDARAGMYRLRFYNGSLSEMVSLTRARDALLRVGLVPNLSAEGHSCTDVEASRSQVGGMPAALDGNASGLRRALGTGQSPPSDKPWRVAGVSKTAWFRTRRLANGGRR